MKKLPIGLLTVMLCGLLAGCSGNGGPQQNAETKAPEAMTEAKQQAEANPTTEAAAAEDGKGQEQANRRTVSESRVPSEFWGKQPLYHRGEERLF